MKKIVILLISAYQKYIPSGKHCRFYPTCSQFTYEAILKYGTIKGLVLGAKRLLKCHPFSNGGFDPVR